MSEYYNLENQILVISQNNMSFWMRGEFEARVCHLFSVLVLTNCLTSLNLKFNL